MSNAHSKISRHSLQIVAAAIHNGHALRPSLQKYMQLSDSERLREEDPHTAEWTGFTPWRIIGDRSRFEFDLNRPPDKSVYSVPEDCWGLRVWDPPLPSEEIQQSQQRYRDFYQDVRRFLDELIAAHGHIVVYDLHSYNHRRNGPEGDVSPVEGNPDINIGTGSVNHDLWRPLVERLIAELRSGHLDGDALDVRENVRFRGGYFSQWIHQTYPQSALCLAIEVKKIFMDEWTGVADPHRIEQIGQLLADSVPGVVKELDQLEPAAG